MTAGTSVFGAYTVMKILLPLALMAVACEAIAQDAQCVREHAAMVETIRDYARFEASVLATLRIFSLQEFSDSLLKRFAVP
jgi:hypothetical protein